MKTISGGVTAAQGFVAAGMHCGVKTSRLEKKDVCLLYSTAPCVSAGAFTKNQVKAAPVLLSQKVVKNGTVRAIAANSGNANACAPYGEENAARMAQCVSQTLGVPLEQVAVASTGVIGQTLNIAVIEDGIPQLAKELSREGGADAAQAIMTTDTVSKEVAVEVQVGGKTVTIGGMSKGSGMIHPNMGTMLCFLTTDVAISGELLQKALLECVAVSFNRISVDGDTSTNDSCFLLANGLAGNEPITAQGEDYETFRDALSQVCVSLARMMAADGEGAKHLITCVVHGAADEGKAEVVGKSIIRSPLVKTAIFGKDANWGRILCAAGYSGVEMDPEKCSITFCSEAGTIAVCEKGRGLPFDEDKAKEILSQKEVVIDFDMGEGESQVTCWGCDLSYDYVQVNGDYRT